jgi:hypothetical protein
VPNAAKVPKSLSNLARIGRFIAAIAIVKSEQIDK